MTEIKAKPCRRLVCVTDVPTPYRLHLFRVLAGVLEERGIKFEVFFMAPGAPHRFWAIDLDEATFPHRISRGLRPTINAITFHVNPGIVYSVTRMPPSWLVLGGGWYIPTVVLLSLLRPLRERYRAILWAEANPDSRRFRVGPVPVLRRKVMGSFDGFAVPGQIAETELKSFLGNPSKPFLRLPNIVDEVVYRDKVRELRNDRASLRAKHGLNGSDLVVVWPARLHEKDKGIVNFLEAVGGIIPEHLKILVAGEGPDREKIEAWLSAERLGGVRLLGHVASADMVELLAVADAFLLPSLSDPNPVSVIEALWAELPLILSDRCGNWPEALEPGRNGWLIDPSSASSMRNGLQELLRLPPDVLSKLGVRSGLIADHQFASRKRIDAFVDDLEQVVLTKRPGFRFRKRARG